MKTFYGNILDKKVDAKGRVILPSEFDISPDDELIAFGSDGSLYLYDSNIINAEVERLNASLIETSDDALIKKLEEKRYKIFSSCAGKVSVDKQGRFLIPKSVRNLIDGTTVDFRGCYDHIEVILSNKRKK